MTETLKVSAAHNGAYSLAANQIGFLYRVFTMHKNVKDNMWLYPTSGEFMPNQFRLELRSFLQRYQPTPANGDRTGI